MNVILSAYLNLKLILYKKNFFFVFIVILFIQDTIKVLRDKYFKITLLKTRQNNKKNGF